ncbi:MAG: YceH family protein [Bryobacterales bacterium]|nr:YceH family protein [Bryobacterales bacterium]
MDAQILFTPEEARVLGCLVEKELTTPDGYPLTLNSLLAACNQKTSRDPVVNYDAATVQLAIQGLKEKGYLRVVSGAEHRVPKYKHDLPFMLRLSPAQTAVLTVLMLRGAQTVGEIRGRTDRMHEFATLDDVAETLRDLMDHMGKQLVTELERLPGTKEPRFAHLLCGIPVVSAPSPTDPWRPAADPSALGSLREDVDALRAELQLLRDEFTAFRQQFEQ